MAHIRVTIIIGRSIVVLDANMQELLLSVKMLEEIGKKINFTILQLETVYKILHIMIHFGIL